MSWEHVLRPVDGNTGWIYCWCCGSLRSIYRRSCQVCLCPYASWAEEHGVLKKVKTSSPPERLTGDEDD